MTSGCPTCPFRFGFLFSKAYGTLGGEGDSRNQCWMILISFGSSSLS